MIEERNHLKTTRERVLETLLTRQKCTINIIAEVVGINSISVRHHITRLEADGLVTSDEERHGVGRPRRVYYLTEAGREQFPTRYVRLTIRLLEQLKETVPQPFVDKLFSQMAQELVADYESKLDGLSMEERLDLVTDLLTDEGFKVDWEKQGNQYIIHEANCPYYYIGQDHPEICSVDQTLISNILSVPAEKIQCMLNGDSQCTYIVPDLSNVEIQEA
jgi:predicted ArsR family transcriptional regulator